MSKLYKNISKILFSTALIISFAFFSLDSFAQNSDQSGKKITYKKARALQSSTAKKMAEVYKAYERLDDDGKEDPDLETVKRVLTELRANLSEMKSYDRSVVWYQWGYIYINEEDIDNAIMAYENVINEPEVTKGLRESGLLTLAQIHLSPVSYTHLTLPTTPYV